MLFSGNLNIKKSHLQRRVNRLCSNNLITRISCQEMLSNYADNTDDDAPKRAKQKSNFVSSNFVLLLVCYLGRLFLHKNARNICAAICAGFRKNIFILTGL